jgi:hypothetical protein
MTDPHSAFPPKGVPYTAYGLFEAAVTKMALDELQLPPKATVVLYMISVALPNV